MLLIAVIVFLTLAHDVWVDATAVVHTGTGRLAGSPLVHHVVLAVTVLCIAVLLATAATAVLANRDVTLRRLDVILLTVAVVLVTAGLALTVGTSDEGALINRAATALLHGQPVYGAAWPEVFTRNIPLTKTMNGGADYTFAYPPGSVLLVAVVRLAVGTAGLAPAIVATVALLIATVVVWRMAPRDVRTFVPVVLLGLGTQVADARSGHPGMIALALLLPVVARWHRTGERGRFTLRDALDAALVGMACATHQLAWFVALFLVLGVALVRRGDLGTARAVRITAAYCGTAAGVWFAVNLPFLLGNPAAWLRGVLLPFTQHAVPDGQGLIDVPLYLTRGSGRLDFYGYAGMLLLAALLVAFVLFPARIAPAITILSAAVFLLATRTPYNYFLFYAALLCIATITVPRHAAAHAWHPRWSARLPRRTKAAVATALLVPAIVCLAVATLSSPPLHMRVSSVTVRSGAVRDLVVDVTNVSGSTIRPHFTFRTGASLSNWWTIRSGPAALAPHASGVYRLTPGSPGVAHEAARRATTRALVAVSDQPMTISVLPITARVP